MEVLNEYFSGLKFKLTEKKQEYGVYVASIRTRLMGDLMRYVIAFVPQHLVLLDKAELHELLWQNLQVRTLKSGTYKNIPSQEWVAPLRNKNIPNLDLRLKKRHEHYSEYSATDFPFEILMIHSPKKNTIMQYPNMMNLHYAIDQFSGVFNLKKEEKKNTIIQEINFELI